MLALALTAFGAALLRELSHPLAAFRLSIAEVERAPQVGRTLHTAGRKPSEAMLADLLAAAQARGLIGGRRAGKNGDASFLHCCVGRSIAAAAVAGRQFAESAGDRTNGSRRRRGATKTSSATK